MRNVLAVFGNRNHTMQFASYLKRLGVRCKTVDTPRALSEACGISVVFFEKDIEFAKAILSKLRLATFRGLYLEVGDIFKKYMRII